MIRFLSRLEESVIIWLWTSFIALIVFLLALDLGVFNRRDHEVSIRESLGWTAFWVALSLVFNGLIYPMYEHHWFGIGEALGHDLAGRHAALQFLTGYLIEKSLSLDNIFVIAIIMRYFRVPGRYQHRLLFWGVLGALVMRGGMIGVGVALIRMFDWIIYVLGALLIVTAVKMMVAHHDEIDPENNLLVRLVRRFLPVSTRISNHNFFTRIDGRRAVTPLFLALLVIETSDLLFAVDSIPAIFSITTDPFLVFTSNVFAILGLRSMYFVLASVMEKFRYLQASLVFILAFVGVKMLLSHTYPIPILVSLAMIAVILVIGVLASVVTAHREARRRARTPA
ncbi:MAG: TerC family protein [Acidobacteriota bacterium]